MWRISKQLGWVPAKATRDQAYAHLSTRVPPDLRCVLWYMHAAVRTWGCRDADWVGPACCWRRYDLHVLLVEHGKRCARCAKSSNAKHSNGACPLVNLDVSVKEEL